MKRYQTRTSLRYESNPQRVSGSEAFQRLAALKLGQGMLVDRDLWTRTGPKSWLYDRDGNEYTYRELRQAFPSTAEFEVERADARSGALYWTDAPEEYDYNYVSTIARGVVGRKGKRYRLISVTDVPQFEDFQARRYASGLYASFPADSRDAEFNGLPSSAEATAMTANASGYVPCACGECFDTTVTSDYEKPALCELCEEAGCEPGGHCARADEDDDYAPNAPQTVDKVIRAALALRRGKAGAMETRGDGIVYSYNLPIGNLQFGNGPYYVLDKRHSPSVTTSKHIGYLMRELPRNEVVIVEDVLDSAEQARGRASTHYIADDEPATAHLRHPAFNGIVGGLRDPKTGIRVLFVDYDDSHPGYDGGEWIEIYDADGELLESEIAVNPPQGFLQAALDAAVEEYG